MGEVLMKRSEALKVIKGLLEVGLDFDTYARADNILCNLEELGMRAPWYFAYASTKKSRLESKEMSDSDYLWIHDWEPEDG
jgi:hypothetical protein